MPHERVVAAFLVAEREDNARTLIGNWLGTSP